MNRRPMYLLAAERNRDRIQLHLGLTAAVHNGLDVSSRFRGLDTIAGAVEGNRRGTQGCRGSSVRTVMQIGLGALS